MEKNEISVYKRIILPIPPRLPDLSAETFLCLCVFA
jgi:hypothetical protein